MILLSVPIFQDLPAVSCVKSSLPQKLEFKLFVTRKHRSCKSQAPDSCTRAE